MLLKDKNAIIYGASGAVGGEVARTFAREGARVFLAGRTKAKLDTVAESVTSGGGVARVSVVDALDEQAVEGNLAEIVQSVGRIDISFNTVGIDNGEQGIPLCELSADDYCRPIQDYARTNFITAKAGARHMVQAGSGVLLSLSVPMVRKPEALAGPFGQAFASVENLARQLALELGPSGVRVVCFRPTGMPETARSLGSHVGEIWQRAADRLKAPLDAFLDEIGSETALGRPLTVSQLADAVTLIASDRGSGITGTVLNVSCGAVVD